jgi:hypothetical protein
LEKEGRIRPIVVGVKEPAMDDDLGAKRRWMVGTMLPLLYLQE